MQSAQKSPHTHTNTHTLNQCKLTGSSYPICFFFPPFSLSKTSISSTWIIFQIPQKKIEQHFSLREVGHAFFITQTCVCMWEDKKRQGREESLSMCVHAMLESRVPASRVFHVICSHAFLTLLSFFLPPLFCLSIFLSLYKLPFHVTCRCHIRSPFILNREVLSFMCLLVFILLTAGVLFMPI